ncbi:MAG TPA: hypothetical protein VGN30_08905 [Steroidobacteraceae bacterium]|jgi:hypothetical protein
MSERREEAIRIAAEALVASIGESDVAAGWPDFAYQTSDDPVWRIAIPSREGRVGFTHYIVISQLTGKVLANGSFGE